MTCLPRNSFGGKEIHRMRRRGYLVSGRWPIIILFFTIRFHRLRIFLGEESCSSVIPALNISTFKLHLTLSKPATVDFQTMYDSVLLCF